MNDSAENMIHVQLSGSHAAVEWVARASPEPPAMLKAHASPAVKTIRCAVAVTQARAWLARTVQTAHANHAVVCTVFQQLIALLYLP